VIPGKAKETGNGYERVSKVSGSHQVLPTSADRSEGELDKAAAVMRDLTRHGFSRLSATESDYLEIPGNLIDEYENKHHPIANLPPHEMPHGWKSRE